MTSESVKVIVRCRPMNEREKNLKCETVVFIDSKRGFCQIKHQSDSKAPAKSFTFDGSYFIDSTTEQIYNEIGYPLVEGVTEGYNGTIFAYGQTGCGKSYTMQGVTSPSSQRGIIPRAFDHIFETISLSDKMKFLVHSSYCEIYNEEIRDLLGKDVKAKLELKEHPDKGVYVQGLTMHPVHNVSECERVMEKGWKNRATGATLMNDDSSRSHSIFSIHLEMITQDDEGEEHIRAGKLNLVDLAGSERQAKTGSTGDRLKEATKINLSLSALGNVISALVDGKSKHIPYRDSKLTRLLQDSLGGNTKTLMVACLSPADNNYDETLSTLRYANRAKNIKNKPKINEDPKDALLREYQQEIERLKAMLMGQIPVPSGAFDADGVPAVAGPRSHEALPSQSSETTREDLELEKEQIREEYDTKLQEIQAMYEEEKINKAKLQQDMSRLREFYDDRLSTVDGQLAHIPTTAEGEKKRAKKSKDKVAVSGVSLAAAASGTMSPRGERSGQTGGTEVGVAAPRSEPRSLHEEHLPEGPGDYDERWSEEDSLQVTSVASNECRDHEAEAAIYKAATLAPERNTMVPQRAVHLSSKKRDDGGGGVSLPDVEREPLPPDHMELLKRLHELQMQMVGGENADNEEIKARHLMRKQVATDRQLELAKAINKMDDDGIMIKIYGKIQNELCDKTDELEIVQEKNEGLKMEIKDLQAEFELDRTDYLDTIRKQEKQLQLYTALIDRIHPCVRRDCNYSNLDKIKAEAQWDDDNQVWILPKLTMERSNLPNAGVMPGGRSEPKSRTHLMMNGDQTSDDRLRRRLEHSNENLVDTYFQPRRASHLLSQPPPDANNLIVRKAKQQLPHTNEIQIQQGRYASINGGGLYQDDINKELRAAQVHGTVNSPEEGLLQRRPQKLESLPTQTSKKSKKKRNALEPI